MSCSCPPPDTRTKPWSFSSCPHLPGQYACKEGRNSPCLVYVTFNQKIYVYWEVQLERMESTNLLKLLEAEPEYHRLLQELRVGECQQSQRACAWAPDGLSPVSAWPADPEDLPAVCTLLHQTLYHPDQPLQCTPSSFQDPT